MFKLNTLPSLGVRLVHRGKWNVGTEGHFLQKFPVSIGPDGFCVGILCESVTYEASSKEHRPVGDVGADRSYFAL